MSLTLEIKVYIMKNLKFGGDILLAQIYYRKKIGIPYLSLLFVLSCFLVSIPTYFNPLLYEVFGSNQWKNYFWQHLSYNLEHGSPWGGLPLPVHLLGNCLVIIVFGVLVERVLGRKHFFFLSVSALFLHILMRWGLGSTGNGASGITWAYAPMVFFIIVKLYRLNREKLIKDPLFYVSICIFLLIWIFITVDSAINGMHHTNIFHLVASIVGIVYTYCYRKRIEERTYEIVTDGSPARVTSSLDQPLLWIHSLIPLLVILVLFLFYSGVLNDYYSPAQVAEVIPNSHSVEEINQENQQILIRFTHAMDAHISKSGFYSYFHEEWGQNSISMNWLNEQTLIIQCERPFLEDESLKIMLDGLRDSLGRLFNGPIVLEYGDTDH